MLASAGLAPAQVVSYEATSFPDDDGWDRVEPYCTPERELNSGLLVIDCDLGCFPPPSGGDRDIYTRCIDEYLGQDRFFVEWRVFADGPSSDMPWGAPAIFSVASQGPVLYYFRLSRDVVRLFRDAQFPAVLVSVESDVPHTLRLELYGPDLFIWFVDAEEVDSGLPEGPYPQHSPQITWASNAAHFPAHVEWDYIRYGVIPVDASGDFDSDGHIDLRDWRYFLECVDRTATLPNDPGCRWADLNADTNVDLNDFATFQTLFGD
jgi:hypothetical protein